MSDDQLVWTRFHTMLRKRYGVWPKDVGFSREKLAEAMVEPNQTIKDLVEWLGEKYGLEEIENNG